MEGERKTGPLDVQLCEAGGFRFGDCLKVGSGTEGLDKGERVVSELEKLRQGGGKPSESSVIHRR